MSRATGRKRDAREKLLRAISTAIRAAIYEELDAAAHRAADAYYANTALEQRSLITADSIRYAVRAGKK